MEAETINANKNKLYYQWYGVKIIRAFHKKEMIKEHIYEKILARRSVVDYSPEIIFEESLIHMSDAKSLTKINQPVKHMRKKWFQWGSIENLQIITRNCPVGIAYWKAENLALDMGISQSEAKKSV